MNGSWGFNLTDRHVHARSDPALVRGRINANLLLNVNDAERPHPAELWRGFGNRAWLAKNGDVIYGTRRVGPRHGA